MVNGSSARGLRINNPGNIRHGASQWQGLAEHQPDKAFCAFTSPLMGVRAMMVLLSTYAGRKIDTIREIVSYWAPPSENATDVYIKVVDAEVPGGPDDILNLRDYDTMVHLVKAIIRHEQGEQPFEDGFFTDAWLLLGNR